MCDFCNCLKENASRVKWKEICHDCKLRAEMEGHWKGIKWRTVAEHWVKAMEELE